MRLIRWTRIALLGAALAATGCSGLLGDFDIEDDGGVEGGVDSSVPLVDASHDAHLDAGGGDHEPDAGADADAATHDGALPDGGEAGTGCPTGEKSCGGKCVAITDPAFGCASPTSCSPCALDHASATCAAGACAIDKCNAGFSDCANGASDGCELPTSADPKHCGNCTTVCNASGGTPNCAGGVCSSIACTAPHADCDQVASTGCEVDTSSDVGHCGGCDHTCGAANGTPSCAGGTCSFACTAPFQHCSGNDADGCSTDTSSDNANCGGCGMACGAGQHCSASKCVCDATSCANGCCTGTTCNAGTAFGVCGGGGAACGACSTTTANACSGGGCKCAGAAACTGAKICCGSGCSDLATDSKNCGTCGHDCQGGACSAGKCQPVALMSNRTGPLSLAIDSTSVYWTENTIGGVYKVAKTGGPLGTMKAADNVGGSAWFVATDGVNVYWTDRTDNYIGYVGVNGGAFGKLAVDAASSQPYGIATNGTFVYWADFGSGSIWRAPTAGAHPAIPTQMGSGSGTTGIGVTAANVLWSEYAGFVHKGVLTGGTTAGTVLTATTNPMASVDTRFLATDGTKIYWTMSDNNSVYAVPIAGGAAVPISTVEAEPWGIAVDATGVYWVNKNAAGAQAGTIRRATLSGTTWTVTTIATGQSGASSIALDASTIYWTNFAGNQVMKLAK